MKHAVRTTVIALLGSYYAVTAVASPPKHTEAAALDKPATAQAELFPSNFAPGSNWAARQFINIPVGASSSDGSFGKEITKGQGNGTARTLATFIPVTPCRLVDTRGAFNPVYSGESAPTVPGAPFNNPFGNGEVRVYSATVTNSVSNKNCGIPVGNNRVRAISVAVTTIPAGAAGDVEAIANGQTLGGTVLMVAAANEWNTATGAVPVDSQTRFQVQLRNFSTHVAIDVNGYYAIMDPANPSDYFSVFGQYDLDGGLFNVTTTSSIGAAINAVSPASEVRLAQAIPGSNTAAALDIVNGGIRVRPNGVNAPVYVFDTTGLRCNTIVGGGLANMARLDSNWVRTAGNLVSGATLSGLMIFVQPRNAAAKPVNVVFGTCLNPSDNNPDGWYLYDRTGAAFADGEKYNVMIVSP